MHWRLVLVAIVSLMRSRLLVFRYAIENEIAIDDFVFDKININTSYVPIRPVKSEKYIKKLKIGSKTYAVLSFLFFITSPLFFLVRMLLYFFSSRKKSFDSVLSRELLLDTSVNSGYIFKKIYNHDVCVFRIQDAIVGSMSIRAFLYSILATIFIFFSLKNKKNIFQCYVAYEFFSVFFALEKTVDKVDVVYFCNHYDRWAVLFDVVFQKKKTIIMQHGCLPEKILLPYRLRNIDEVYVINEASVELFSNLVLEKNNVCVFKFMMMNLNLTEVNSLDQKSILVIGQPHLAEKEREIVASLGDEYFIFIKPHPAFSSDLYLGIENASIIHDPKYYPKVDLALNYESTLGVEYEASGVNVLCWKGLTAVEVVRQVKERMNCA